MIDYFFSHVYNLFIIINIFIVISIAIFYFALYVLALHLLF